MLIYCGSTIEIPQGPTTRYPRYGFMKLPVEIQIQIWELVLPQQPRHVELEKRIEAGNSARMSFVFGPGDSYRPYMVNEIWNPSSKNMKADNAAVRLLLHTCQLSREIASKSYEAIGGHTPKSAYFYFDLAKDTLELNDDVKMCKREFQAFFSKRFQENLHRLRLHDKSAGITPDFRSGPTRHFTALKEISLTNRISSDPFLSGWWMQSRTQEKIVVSREIIVPQVPVDLTMKFHLPGKVGSTSLTKRSTIVRLAALFEFCKARNPRFKTPDTWILENVMIKEHQRSQGTVWWKMRLNPFY